MKPRSFVVVSLALLSAASFVACSKLRRARGASTESIACDSALSFTRGPTGNWVLTGQVRTAPSTTVFVMGVPRGGNAQMVADAQGAATFNAPLAQFENAPSSVTVQCGFVGQSGNRSIVAQPSRQLFFVDDHRPSSVVCEGRRCEISLSADQLTFTAPAGARLTVDGQTTVATGASQSIALNVETMLEGVPLGARRSGLSGGDGWDDFTRLRPSKTVSLQLADGTTLQRTLNLTSRAVTFAYGRKFSGAATGAVLPASAPRGQGALYFHGIALMQVFGPVQRFSDVAYVAVTRDGAERRASCGRYRRGSQTISVDRVMRDGIVEVFDPRTGQKLHSETIRAPERQCLSSMQSVTAVMSEFDSLSAENAFARWFAQRSGGHAPGALGFDTVSEAAPTPAASTGAADGGAGDASSGSASSEAPSDAPDPAFRAEVSTRLGSLGYTVTAATSSVDAVSGAQERRATLRHESRMSTEISMIEYDRDHRPNGTARYAMHGSSVTIVSPLEDTTLSDGEFRSLLAINGGASAVGAGLRRARFTPDSDPRSDDDFEGGIEVSATAANGDRSLSFTLRNYSGVPQGGDDPRALRITGNRVWRASGNDTRAELDRILRAIAR